ncbi:hypothetical protein GTO91_04130 [Heliobacterium undosum]|uniref:Uncharacterized protein n=1 Tax=Heliomicrobium undosum TaxID=121734 RepID=A0A845KYF9_9FIRM|nr:hypothetical protein [Heliomicrobium undosum]MZP28897.1 hypothetical protein [Heliomicrobium undosum]
MMPPESVREQDIKQIIRKTLTKGFTGEELLDELTHRLTEYDDFIARKIQGFDQEIAEGEDESVAQKGSSRMP